MKLPSEANQSIDWLEIVMASERPGVSWRQVNSKFEPVQIKN